MAAVAITLATKTQNLKRSVMIVSLSQYRVEEPRWTRQGTGRVHRTAARWPMSGNSELRAAIQDEQQD